MDLNFTPAELAFRHQVRNFLAQALPDDISRKVHDGLILERDDYVRWQRILHAQAGAAPHWPAEFGGTGWSVVQQYIFEEECAAAGAPRLISVRPEDGGPGDHGLRLARRSNSASCRASWPAEDWWCQGYSEPGAGSDLASLKTRAERVKARRRSSTSSTARRPGPRSASTPTGSSAWCAPTPRPSRSAASPSC